jgi:hypothetical protein
MSSQCLRASSSDRFNLLSLFTTLVFNLHAYRGDVIAVRTAFLPKARRPKKSA